MLKSNESEAIIENLKERSTFVYWKNKNRKNYFCIIAKTIERKEDLRKKGYLAFDLEDFMDTSRIQF